MQLSYTNLEILKQLKNMLTVYIIELIGLDSSEQLVYLPSWVQGNFLLKHIHKNGS